MTEEIYRQHESRAVLLSPHYGKHVSHMTTEDLYGKGEIAEELAARDMEIERLRAELAAIKGQEPISLDEFAEWFCRQVPSGTVIGDPGWWAGRIFRKIGAAPVADKDAERLLGLCKWAAGRLTDAGDDEGSAKVLGSLAAMARGE